MRPELTLFNRQRTHAFDLSLIRQVADAARADCLDAALSEDAPLVSLEGVEVSILSDRAIAKVHGEFFQDPTPTDVITFHHGELLLGAGILVENARQYGKHSASHEAALCVIHGMLHLAGWDDLTARDAKKMANRQERIFKNALRVLE